MPQAAAGLDLRSAVVRALEDDRYDWRTIGGIASDLGVAKAEVVSILQSMPDDIITTKTEDGRNVFTTRRHYEKTHGLGDKILSALADKVVA